MLQFYFLAVICTFLTGLYFAFNQFFIERIPENLKMPLLDTAFILCAVTGILKLFLVVQPDVVIIGDLLPAIACLVAAFCLFLEIFDAQAGKVIPLPPVIRDIVSPETETTGGFRKYLGFLLMVIGILHFFIPAVRVF
ncbi:MAG: hypothetical protein MJ178_02125 [Treponemataceae bacterium]|nr:hypothetical protein [Treponemataceae bacterium]